MGRPLAKRFFGNTNAGGIGGEGVLAVATGTGGTGYSKGVTVTVSAPNLVIGTQAVVTATVNGGGKITKYVVTNSGSGYTSAPTVALVQPANATPTATGVDTQSTVTVSSAAGVYVGMTATGTNVGAGAVVQSIAGDVVTLTAPNTGAVSGTVTFADAGASAVPGAVTMTPTPVGTPGAITLTARTVGSTARTGSDIVKQTGSRRYKVQNQDGMAVCALVARAPAAVGEAALIATDSSGCTYYVTRLTMNMAVLTPFGAGAHEFVLASEAKWTMDAAVHGYSVTLTHV